MSMLVLPNLYERKRRKEQLFWNVDTLQYFLRRSDMQHQKFCQESTANSFSNEYILQYVYILCILMCTSWFRAVLPLLKKISERLDLLSATISFNYNCYVFLTFQISKFSH